MSVLHSAHNSEWRRTAEFLFMLHSVCRPLARREGRPSPACQALALEAVRPAQQSRLLPPLFLRDFGQRVRLFVSRVVPSSSLWGEGSCAFRSVFFAKKYSFRCFLRSRKHFPFFSGSTSGALSFLFLRTSPCCLPPCIQTSHYRDGVSHASEKSFFLCSHVFFQSSTTGETRENSVHCQHVAVPRHH